MLHSYAGNAPGSVQRLVHGRPVVGGRPWVVAVMAITARTIEMKLTTFLTFDSVPCSMLLHLQPILMVKSLSCCVMHPREW